MTTPAAAPEIAGHSYARHINSGGFADVFLYAQMFPAREVAIKVLRPLHDGAVATEQFEAEANVMAQLSGHPSIVEIYSAGRSDDGRSYIVMEFCPPPALVDRYRTERLPVEEVLDIGIRIASAVETAHRAGILHRDIKPHNILRSAYGTPKLTDFGIAGLTGSGGGEDGSTYGLSIPWASPEALREEAGADPRSDVFSLAATLYSLLAQRSPFEIPGAANDDATLISRIERQPPAPLRRADVPDSLNDVLARAMAKRPEDRPHSALALAQRLQDIQTQLGFAHTRIEVFDASPEAGEQIEENGGTRIRPVKIVLPEEIAARGTKLRPKIVRPPVVDDRTRRRPEVPRESSAVADPSSVLPPEPEMDVAPPADAPAATTDHETQPRGSMAKLIVGGVGAAVLAGVVGFALLAGDPAVEPPSTGLSPPPVPVPPGDYVPPLTDFRARPLGGGRVAFSWTNDEPRPGDRFAVKYRVDDRQRPIAKLTQPEFEVTARRGTIVCAQVQLVRSDATASLATDQKCVASR